MRFLCCFILLLGCFFAKSSTSYAQQKTEKDLVNEIILNFQYPDDSAYTALFPDYTFMSGLIMQYQPKDSMEMVRINKIRNNIRHIAQFDPELNKEILDMMDFVRQKGADSGIHWNDILIAKYELDKQRLPYELIGFELIAPIRMQGFIFIKDMLTRKRYGITVKDIYMMDGKWYGGRVINILQASNEAEYEESLRAEQKELQHMMKLKQEGKLDSFLAVRDSIRKHQESLLKLEEEEEIVQEEKPKEIADRKLFLGYFDKIMEVDLYIRYIKGSCPEEICSWEAMYRFDDMSEFILLDVEQKEDGTFVFTEDELGVMELKLQGNTFTGTWTSVTDKTEYEVYLKEIDAIKDRRLQKLDKEFEYLKEWE